MKKKLVGIFVCMLLITTLTSFSATAIYCEKKPSTIIITENSPPDDPILEISETVRIGGILYINAVTTDPDNDNIYYRLSLLENVLPWEGPFQSGEELSIKAKLNLLFGIGTFTLGVQAKDCKGAESDWTYKDFKVTIDRSVTSLFLRFLQIHPNLFPILRLLL